MATTTQKLVLEPIDDASLYPDALRSAERRHEHDARIGIALSGGGIRSATLSLGFFQGLAQRALVRYVDILSTVSGGGYFGGFFGHLVQRAAEPAPGGTMPRDRALADEVLQDPNARPVRFLRENGRYLAPNGAGDLFAAAAGALRNWVSVIVVLGLLALLVLTLVTLLRFVVEGIALGRVPAVAWPAWLSPLFLLAIAAIPVLAVPPGWSYWLVRDNPQSDGSVRMLAKWVAPVGAVAVAAYLLTPAWADRAHWALSQWALAVFGVTAALTMGRFAVAALFESSGPHVLRDHLTRGLTRALLVIAVLLLLAIIDSVGQGIVTLSQGGLVALYGGAAGLIGVFRTRLLDLATRLRANERTALPTTVLVTVAAALLLLAFLGGIASVPHFVARSGQSIPPWLPMPTPEGALDRLLIVAGICGLLALAISQLWSFVNRSSMHAIYEARLRRAYLGASNPARSGEGEARPPVTEPHADDGLRWSEYDPSRSGGPMHLINVTINETVDGSSQVQQRDRKGVGMAIGPAGVTVGRTHHALWKDQTLIGVFSQLRAQAVEAYQSARNALSRARRGKQAAKPPASTAFRVFPSTATPELLDVGQWMAISGGAVSTGLGARTNIALSILIGFFNVRLGYWWQSGVNPADRVGRTARTGTQRMFASLRRALPVQFALLDEWLARFPGVARPEWNLTDGGHFENLGAYELIRRRLPLIIVCDNEQDPGYEFSGLANLVRKARTDLSAEITFLSDSELRETEGRHAPPARMPACVGSLDALRRGRRTLEAVTHRGTEDERLINDGDVTGLSLVHAALARIEYGPTDQLGTDARSEPGWLLYVKPSLVGDEPVDVRHYHTEHPEFPHESTADQFFDEAQWESYRRLGEHIARKLFASQDGLGTWVERVAAGT